MGHRIPINASKDGVPVDYSSDTQNTVVKLSRVDKLKSSFNKMDVRLNKDVKQSLDEMCKLQGKKVQEIDNTVFKDTGIYSQNQYKKAYTTPLLIAEEDLLGIWGAEAKDRPNFDIRNNVVYIPTVCVELKGVATNNLKEYVKYVRSFGKESVITCVDDNIHRYSFRQLSGFGDYTTHGRVNFGKVQEIITSTYKWLNQHMQLHMAQKLFNLLTDKNVNVDQNVILRVAKNLPTDVLNQLHTWDFTKEVPKVLLVNNTGYSYTKEEVVFIMYLKLLGFDIVLINPTGKNVLGNYISSAFLQECEVGLYVTDITDLPKTKGHLFIKEYGVLMVLLSLLTAELATVIKLFIDTFL